ncbi:MAG: MAPEG family protein [Cellvibrionaceae bacterium]
MITGFYAGLLALFFVWLSLNVVKLRRRYKVAYGSGGVEPLEQAISAHNNMSQYSPVMLLLLFFLEYQQVHFLLIHLGGLLFVIGRLIHFRGMTEPHLKKRVLGMQLTLFPILAYAALNLLWPFYRWLLL